MIDEADQVEEQVSLPPESEAVDEATDAQVPAEEGTPVEQIESPPAPDGEVEEPAVTEAPTVEPPADVNQSPESEVATVEEDEVAAVEEDFADEDDEDADMNAQPVELIEDTQEVPEDLPRRWYILKVQVNRETTICDALRRRVKVAGLDSYFDDILVPTEDVREFTKSGKQRVVKRKLYPGYILVNMAITDDSWFLVRETPGIGDFTGSAGKPTPMQDHEVERILATTRPQEETEAAPKIGIKFKPGDRVRVKEGYFQNFEGEVETIDEANGRITVMINIFGRATPVELDHWQFEDV